MLVYEDQNNVPFKHPKKKSACSTTISRTSGTFLTGAAAVHKSCQVASHGLRLSLLSKGGTGGSCNLFKCTLSLRFHCKEGSTSGHSVVHLFHNCNTFFFIQIQWLPFQSKRRGAHSDMRSTTRNVQGKRLIIQHPPPTTRCRWFSRWLIMSSWLINSWPLSAVPRCLFIQILRSAASWLHPNQRQIKCQCITRVYMHDLCKSQSHRWTGDNCRRRRAPGRTRTCSLPLLPAGRKISSDPQKTCNEFEYFPQHFFPLSFPIQKGSHRQLSSFSKRSRVTITFFFRPAASVVSRGPANQRAQAADATQSKYIEALHNDTAASRVIWSSQRFMSPPFGPSTAHRPISTDPKWAGRFFTCLMSLTLTLLQHSHRSIQIGRNNF